MTTVQNDDASIPADEWVMRADGYNVDAGGLVPVLRPLMPQWAHMSVMPPASRLIIMDRYANVRRITEIVRLLDVPARN